jgi:hypothetical protein
MSLIKTTAVVSTICLKLKKRPMDILFRPILVVIVYNENTEKVTGHLTLNHRRYVLHSKNAKNNLLLLWNIMSQLIDESFRVW